MPDGYFQGAMANRQPPLWAIATRVQLERWEPLVAANLIAGLEGSDFPDRLIWQAETEHHFLLIAGRNLLRAIDVTDTETYVDPVVRSELVEGRDLHEHWPENMPLFNVTPRVGSPTHRSGKAFAARNPDTGPYSWLSWDSLAGPLVLPNVPASSMHALVDEVEAVVMERDPLLSRFLLERQRSPWLGPDHGSDRWWPRPVSRDETDGN